MPPIRHRPLRYTLRRMQEDPLYAHMKSLGITCSGKLSSAMNAALQESKHARRECDATREAMNHAVEGLIDRIKRTRALARDFKALLQNRETDFARYTRPVLDMLDTMLWTVPVMLMLDDNPTATLEQVVHVVTLLQQCHDSDTSGTTATNPSSEVAIDATSEATSEATSTPDPATPDATMVPQTPPSDPTPAPDLDDDPTRIKRITNDVREQASHALDALRVVLASRQEYLVARALQQGKASELLMALTMDDWLCMVLKSRHAWWDVRTVEDGMHPGICDLLSTPEGLQRWVRVLQDARVSPGQCLMCGEQTDVMIDRCPRKMCSCGES